MATRLAGAGVVTVVMHYSLFPGTRVPDMVDEVSAALSWTLNHCAALGGDPSRVRFVLGLRRHMLAKLKVMMHAYVRAACNRALVSHRAGCPCGSGLEGLNRALLEVDRENQPAGSRDTRRQRLRGSPQQ